MAGIAMSNCPVRKSPEAGPSAGVGVWFMALNLGRTERGRKPFGAVA